MYEKKIVKVWVKRNFDLVECLLGCKFEWNLNYFVKERYFFFVDVFCDFDDFFIIFYLFVWLFVDNS